ncbi:MAG: hypothetical protein KBD00_02935 [Candidatus Peribacteraceae bacterium]|nr:hypothetical protein [Candidatus Peribacteraceae bacterium]
MRLTRSLFVTVLCLSIASVHLLNIPKAHADLQASISIEQVSPALLGTWTFFSTDNTTKSSKDKGVDAKKTAFSFRQFGPVTLSIKQPAGMKSTVLIYRNGNLVSTKDTTQATVTLYPNDTLRFLIRYSFSNVGTLGITSIPTGAQLTVTGPDGFAAKARAPYTFKNLPAGKYTVIADQAKGCMTSPPYNRYVEQDKRVTLTIDLPCTAKTGTDIIIENSRQTKRAIQEAARLREALRAAKKGS